MKMPQIRHAAHARSAINKTKHDEFGRRLLKLGPASLMALVAGGLILILTAVSALGGPRQNGSSGPAWVPIHQDVKDDGIDRFGIGHTWSIQVWLVTVGAGFGLLSHGFLEAYFHLLDWWCSRKAQSSAGLEYGRYLNAQPRAPVTYGIRGFPFFSTLRYLLLLITIAASIGYKFAITEMEALLHEHVDPEALFVSVPMAPQPFRWRGETSPWFRENALCFMSTQPAIDGTISNSKAMRVIIQEATADTIDPNDPTAPNLDYDKPPLNITMVGLGTASGYLTAMSEARGVMTSREVVAIASVTDDIGNFIMSRKRGDWYRVETLGTQWPGVGDRQAVVDCRILEHGSIQIQWAPLGPWLTDDNLNEIDQKVTQRLTYTVHYTTVEVKRAFLTEVKEGRGILFSYGGVIALGQNGPFPSVRKSNKLLDARSKWIDAQVADQDASAIVGINAIVRGIMYEWAMIDSLVGLGLGGNAPPEYALEEEQADFAGEYLRTLPTGEYPFGREENATSERMEYYSESEYPYFLGVRPKGLTGCYRSASVTFLAIGILAWLFGILRLWIGPAVLTSWTGQHIYLSRIGVISSLQSQDDLASEYLVAPAQLGRLHLRYPKMEDSESSNFREDENGYPGSTESEEQPTVR